MRRFAHSAILLCILAVWMQLLAPAAAMQADDGLDTFSVLCAHAQTDQNGPVQGGHHHQHEHCLLCQAGFSGPPLSDRAPVVPPRPLPVRRLMWRPNAARAPPSEQRRLQQPRGPPTLL